MKKFDVASSKICINLIKINKNEIFCILFIIVYIVIGTKSEFIYPGPD